MLREGQAGTCQKALDGRLTPHRKRRLDDQDLGETDIREQPLASLGTIVAYRCLPSDPGRPGTRKRVSTFDSRRDVRDHIPIVGNSVSEATNNPL